MSKSNPTKTISAGYAASEPPARDPLPFRPNERMEQLLKLRDSDPATFATFGATTRIEVGLYEGGRNDAGYTGDDDDASAA